MSSRGYIANQSICDWEQDFLIGGKWWLVISFERSWLLHLQWVQRAKWKPRLLSVIDTLILAIHKSAWLVAKDFDFIPIPFWSQCQMLLQRDYTTPGSILHSSLLCTTWTSLVPNPKELWIRPGNEARPEAEQLGNETHTYLVGECSSVDWVIAVSWSETGREYWNLGTYTHEHILLYNYWLTVFYDKLDQNKLMTYSGTPRKGQPWNKNTFAWGGSWVQG